MARRSGWRKGRGRRMVASTTLKMAELAPMPRASTVAASAVKPGARRSTRAAYRRSWRKVSMRLRRRVRGLVRREGRGVYSAQEHDHSDSQFTIRGAHPAEEPGVYPDGRGGAGIGDRGEYRDL